MSVVTQPGVDFGHTSIYPFEPEKAQALSDAILEEKGLTFEAHSTDYQSISALAALVKNHFFFLKVGPELTFRFREAIWALATVEEQLGLEKPSCMKDVLAEQMTANPDYWKDYYNGTADELETLKIFSYSDRIRYYWANDKVSAAVDRLVGSLSSNTLPETLLSQSFMGLEFGDMSNDPNELIEQHVQRCVGRYFEAAGH